MNFGSLENSTAYISNSLLVTAQNIRHSICETGLTFQEKEKVRINIRGMKYETYQETLEKFPNTLLGSADKRDPFYDPVNEEYYFDRNKAVFDCILFFYQSNGILSKPDDISYELFKAELTFYELDYDKEETNTSPETSILRPPGLIRRTVWEVLELPHSSVLAKFVANVSVLMILLSTIIFCLETVPEVQPVGSTAGNAYQQHLSTASMADNVVCSGLLGEHERKLNATGWMLSFQKTKNESLNGTSTKGGSNNCTELNKIGAPVRPTQAVNADSDIWFILESVFISFFTCEYLARLYSSPMRIHFMKSSLGIVDFVAILPYFLTLILQHDYQNVTSFSVIRVTRIVRVMRVLKLSRYNKGLAILGRTIKASSDQIKSLFLCVFLTVVLFSSAIYYLESIEDNSPFESIPATFWYCIITMTTVGYGDVLPLTPLGKLAGAICVFVGIILLLCLPTPVFVSNFVRFYNEECMDDQAEVGEHSELEPESKPKLPDSSFKNMNYVTVKTPKVLRRDSVNSTYT